MGVSGRVQELLLDPIIFDFLNNDLEVNAIDSGFYIWYHSVKFCTEVMTE